MAKAYRPYVPEQDLLLPSSLREWLREDHLALFVSDLVDQLDLSACRLGNGHIKQARGFRRVCVDSRRQGEWSLVCTTRNILKLYRLWA